MTQTVKVIRHNEIVELRLNRPDQFNALNFDMAKELSDNLASLAVDQSLRGVVITGEGRAFCAGGDLKWVSEFEGGNTSAGIL